MSLTLSSTVCSRCFQSLVFDSNVPFRSSFKLLALQSSGSLLCDPLFNIQILHSSLKNMKRLNTIVNEIAAMPPDSRAQQVPGGHEWPEAVTMAMRL